MTRKKYSSTSLFVILNEAASPVGGRAVKNLYTTLPRARMLHGAAAHKAMRLFSMTRKKAAAHLFIILNEAAALCIAA